MLLVRRELRLPFFLVRAFGSRGQETQGPLERSGMGEGPGDEEFFALSLLPTHQIILTLKLSAVPALAHLHRAQAQFHRAEALLHSAEAQFHRARTLPTYQAAAQAD